LHSFIAFLVLLSRLYNRAFWLQFLINLLTYLKLYSEKANRGHVSKFLVVAGPLPTGHVKQRMRNGHFRV